jgi:hypothetical protein
VNIVSQRTFKRLKIRLETPIATPGNGAVNNGNINQLLLLMNDGTKHGKRYLVKGLRGLMNHSMMSIAQQKGIEVCHSSNKETTKEGENLLPEGFHLTGDCYPEDECLKHRIMGSIKKASVLRFQPVIIISHKVKGPQEEAQKVHISTNDRNVLVHRTRKAIQHFGDRYFSGEFTLMIELLTELSLEELGFLIEAVLYAPELGLGAKINDGSGKLILHEVALQKVTRTRTIGSRGKVIEEENERNLWKEMEEALKVWAKV